MKKFTIGAAVLFLLVAAATPLYAARDRGNFQIDGSFALGTGPADFDSGFGFTIGTGYMMKNIDENLQARIDLSYFQFDRDVPGASLDYTRIPVTISGRYYFPVQDSLNLFAEAGLETSFDDFEIAGPLGTKNSESEVNVGVTPGGGVEFFVNPNVSVFALGRYHVISDDYFSMHFGGAVHY